MRDEILTVMTVTVTCLSPVDDLKPQPFPWSSCSHPAGTVRPSSDVPPPAANHRFTRQHGRRLVLSPVDECIRYIRYYMRCDFTLASLSWVSRPLFSSSSLVTTRHNFWPRREGTGGIHYCLVQHYHHTKNSNVFVEYTSFLEPSRSFLIACSSFLALLSSPRSLAMVRSNSSLWVTAVSCAMEEFCRSCACSPLSFSLRKLFSLFLKQYFQKLNTLFLFLIFFTNKTCSCLSLALLLDQQLVLNLSTKCQTIMWGG